MRVSSAELAAHIRQNNTDIEVMTAQRLAAAAATQPVDSDLTAIAALSTTSFGRGLLTLADAAALAESHTHPGGGGGNLDDALALEALL